MTHRARQQVEYAALVSAEQAADYFESVAAGIRQHVMLVESGNDSIELDVADMMKLEAEFHADEKKSSIEFELSWQPAAGHTVAAPALHVLTSEDLGKRERLAQDIDGRLVGDRATTGRRDGEGDVEGDGKAARKRVTHARTKRAPSKRRTAKAKQRS
jgi:amphi-Trp domain-containing protein